MRDKIWRSLRDKKPVITAENAWVYAEAEKPAEVYRPGSLIFSVAHQGVRNRVLRSLTARHSFTRVWKSHSHNTNAG